MDAFFYGIYRIQFICKLCKDNNICYEHFHHISVPGFIDAFYGIYRILFQCKLCKETITFVMKIFILFLFWGTWMRSFIAFIEFNLNLNCVKTITLDMKIFIIFLFQFIDAFFYGIYRIQFKCKLCKETITFVMKIFILFLFQDS